SVGNPKPCEDDPRKERQHKEDRVITWGAGVAIGGARQLAADRIADGNGEELPVRLERDGDQPRQDKEDEHGKAEERTNGKAALPIVVQGGEGDPRNPENGKDDGALEEHARREGDPKDERPANELRSSAEVLKAKVERALRGERCEEKR